MAEQLPASCGMESDNEKDWNYIVKGVKTLLLSIDKNAATVFPICMEHQNSQK